MIGINSLPAVSHQPEFAAHCITPDADNRTRTKRWRIGDDVDAHRYGDES
jgi:hypothetical protein